MIRRSLKVPHFTRKAIFALADNAKFVEICQRSAPMVRIRYMMILLVACVVAIAVSRELSLYFSATEMDFRGVQNTQQLQKWVMAGKLRV